MNFKQTSLESIPNDWEVVRLGEVGEIVTGTTPSTKKIEYYGGPYMFISPFDLGENKYVYKTQKWLSKKGLEVSRPLPKDTVLVVCIGSTTGKTGMTFSDNCATNQQINAIICHSGTISPFLYYMLTYKANYIGSLASKVAVPILNKNNFSKIKIPLPPFPEQQKIATVLSTIQRAIEQQDKIIETTRKLKKSLLHTLFTEGMNGEEQKETEIGRVPKSWEVVRLGDITEKTKQTDQRKNPNNKFKYIDVSGISNEFFQIVEFKEYLGKEAPSRARKVIKANDIIFATVRPYLKRVAIVPDAFDGEICSTAFCVVRCKREIANPIFVFNCLLNDAFVDKVSELQRGSSYPAVTDKDVLNQKIPLPPLPEQQQITHILSTVDKKTEIEERRKATLKELFKTMLHKLMTGEIRLKDVNI
ncbi:MAG: restriction endonuclease subunit S [Methanophagales archaeon]|nr:restriction endonuclease subunit S [Methanophagales archaeon]